jgi:hypothetical protein
MAQSHTMLQSNRCAIADIKLTELMRPEQRRWSIVALIWPRIWLTNKQTTRITIEMT